MFMNAGTSRLTRFWEDDLRQRIGFVGRTNAFTDEDCMFRAMRLFINFFAKHFQYGGYCFLVTLYQSVLAVEHDQRMNEYGRAVKFSAWSRGNEKTGWPKVLTTHPGRHVF